MTIASKLLTGIGSLLEEAGKQVRINYFNIVPDSVYDDVATLLPSGNFWTSGIVLPIMANKGSTESILMEQGKLISSDQMLYLQGSIPLIGSELTVKIDVGSPPVESFTLMGEVIAPEVSNQQIYKKAYIRRLTGSMIGE